MGLVPTPLLSVGSPTLTDLRLFRVPTGYATRFRLETAGGWTLIVDRYYEGEPWSPEDRSVYEGMSLAECADVLLSEVSAARL